MSRTNHSNRTSLTRRQWLAKQAEEGHWGNNARWLKANCNATLEQTLLILFRGAAKDRSGIK